MPVPEIDIDEFARRREQGAPVIDVREPDEYQAGHVPGATLIPLATVPDRLGEVPAERRRARDLQERGPQHAGRRVPGRQRRRPRPTSPAAPWPGSTRAVRSPRGTSQGDRVPGLTGPGR